MRTEMRKSLEAWIDQCSRELKHLRAALETYPRKTSSERGYVIGAKVSLQERERELIALKAALKAYKKAGGR